MNDWPNFDPDPDRPETWLPEPLGMEEARQKQKRKPNGHADAHEHDARTEDETSSAFAPIPWVYRDPATIPPREWLLGTTLLRGYATVLGSTGGVGKTAYAIALALAFITGRKDILDQHVFQTGKAWIITLEDDRENWSAASRRRYSCTASGPARSKVACSSTRRASAHCCSPAPMRSAASPSARMPSTCQLASRQTGSG